MTVLLGSNQLSERPAFILPLLKL